MKKVQLITDGACKGNPGRGGWAYVLRYNEHRREAWGSEPQTTNNRMELTAAVRGLEALKETCEVEIVTDSVYEHLTFGPEHIPIETLPGARERTQSNLLHSGHPRPNRWPRCAPTSVCERARLRAPP